MECNNTVAFGWQPLNKIFCELLLKMTITVYISCFELIIEYQYFMINASICKMVWKGPCWDELSYLQSFNSLGQRIIVVLTSFRRKRDHIPFYFLHTECRNLTYLVSNPAQFSSAAQFIIKCLLLGHWYCLVNKKLIEKCVCFKRKQSFQIKVVFLLWNPVK